MTEGSGRVRLMAIETQMIAAVKPEKDKPPCLIFSTGKTGFLSITITTYCRSNLDATSVSVLQLPNVGKFCEKCETNFKEAVKQLSK